MPFYTKKTNKPIRNYQKKKYYTNRNTKSKKSHPDLDGTFAVDAKTFECKYIPNDK